MIIYVYSGLMSRTRLLAEAYYLCKQYEKRPRLTILWPMEANICNVKYDDIFDKNQFNDIRIRIINLRNNSKNVRALFRGHKYIEFICAVIQKVIEKTICFIYMNKLFHHRIDIDNPPKIENNDFTEYSEWKKCKWNEVVEALSETRQVCLKTYEKSPKKSDVDFLASIVFKSEFITKAKRIIRNDNIIGIHIRRTDHTRAIELSPTDLFVEIIRKEIEKDSNIEFFLSTDDIKTEDHIINIFNNRIIVQADKKWGRNSKEEVQAGLIDCICLSMCKRIIGSCTSQFSEFAAEYGNIQIDMCKK